MHIRVSTKRQGGKSYTYAQLVESYRRADGLPTHRVVASLGKLSTAEIENIRLALKASRQGKTLILEGAAENAEWRPRVLASLRYLDVAVALETWQRWELPQLFNRLIPKGLDAARPASVIAALVVQRCTDPGSKLYAQRWFPRTALPELLDIEVEQFNNTRIHRVLEELDRVDEELQVALPKRYQQKEGAFATIFMDVSDAWFSGRGPDMAERSRTKEGFHNRRKIGIVLVCNERGYPLRWKTTPGKRRDPQCMEEMLAVVEETSWIGEAPLVCDRGMGNASSVAKLVESGIRFLTATPRNEIGSYTDSVPHEPFLALAPVASEITLKSEIEVASKTAEAAGLKRVDDRLYVTDLGVCERELVFERPRYDHSGASWNPNELEGGASFIALARIFQDRIDRKEYRSRSHLAEGEGLTRARVTQIMNTLRVHENLQEGILKGEFGYVPERLLRECVRYASEEEQRRLLDDHAKKVFRRSARLRPPRRVGKQTVRVRLVAYFNPQLFVEQRARFSVRRQRVEDFIDDLNRRFLSAHSHREKDSVRVEVHNQLARSKLLSVYEVRIRSVRDAESERRHWKVSLSFDEEEWKRRVRYAGFVLLVAHPEMPHSAEDIVALYRQKDTIEKDFQTIKDTVKLRPMYHHTDSKVRAHVTLCMLALLLERTIERRLKRSGFAGSAAACFEELEPCRLSLITTCSDLAPAYLATEATQLQESILRSLRMKDLVDAEEIASQVHPRAR